MANKIQIRRGSKDDLPTLLPGEFGYCTDTNELYLGGPKGNVLVTGKIDPNNLTAAVPIAKGGTGAVTAGEALANLGAASISHNHDSVYAAISHGTHVSYGTATSALTSGGTGAIGSAVTLARSDHTHTLPAYPTLSSLGAQPSLGFTPVQQGGGSGQGANKICLGWDNASYLKAQVDSTDLGGIITTKNIGNQRTNPLSNKLSVEQTNKTALPTQFINIEDGTLIQGYYDCWKVLNMGDISNGILSTQIAMPCHSSAETALFIRKAFNNTTFGDWKKVSLDGHTHSNYLPLSGGTLTGTLYTQSIGGTNLGNNNNAPTLTMSSYMLNITGYDTKITGSAGISMVADNIITMSSINPITLTSTTNSIFLNGSQGTQISSNLARSTYYENTINDYYPLVIWSDTDAGSYRSNTSISGNRIQARHRGNTTSLTNFSTTTLYLNNLGGDIELGWYESKSYMISYLNNFFLSKNESIGIGTNALYNSRMTLAGSHNIAIGQQALEKLSSQYALYNIAIGSYAGLNVNGSYNTVMGFDAFKDIGTSKTAENNTVIGAFALTSSGASNTNPIKNCVAIGAYALYNHKANSNYNLYGGAIAIGYQALMDSTTGPASASTIAIGAFAGQGCQNYNNIFIGDNAGYKNSTHATTICLGNYAGQTGYGGGSNNIYIGNYCGQSTVTNSATSYKQCTMIGYTAIRPTGDNQIRLGNSTTTTYTNGAVNTTSDERDKTEIRSTVLGLDFINKVEAIDFKWDMRCDYIEAIENVVGIDENGNDIIEIEYIEHEKDGSKKRNRYHHGVRAQQIKNVIEETGIDFGGFQDHSVNGGEDVLTMGYEEFIAPLIKAVQELHSIVMEQGKVINRLQEKG